MLSMPPNSKRARRSASSCRASANEVCDVLFDVEAHLVAHPGFETIPAEQRIRK
jgi:hypothetical protein